MAEYGAHCPEGVVEPYEIKGEMKDITVREEEGEVSEGATAGGVAEVLRRKKRKEDDEEACEEGEVGVRLNQCQGLCAQGVQCAARS